MKNLQLKQKQALKSGFLLALFTLICVFFVSLTQQETKAKIKHNEQQLLIQRLAELVSGYDNNILQDKYQQQIRLHGLLQTINIYPTKKHNKVFAYLIEHTYPNGYNGNIRLLSGIDISNKLLGVRVITHKETPGLGDKIELRKSDWVKQFSGLSLKNPPQSSWKMKNDGGSFDAFTGATITPRALVNATYQLLDAFAKYEIKRF